MTTVRLLILVALLHLATSHTLSYTSLTFGKDATSYILMQPDLTPIQEEFSICAWIKRMSDHLDEAQYWLSYVTTTNIDEVVISDGGQFWLFRKETSFRPSSLTTGVWHHICITFSYSDLTKRVYYDGVLIKSDITPSGRTLNVPGSLMFGQLHHQYGGGKILDCCYFGGTMFGTTIYSTELSSDQIQEMYTQGRCAGDSKDSLTDVTFLSWQDILKEERHGNVVEEELEEGCDTEHDHPDEDEDTDQDDSAEDEDTDHSQFRKNQSTRVVMTCSYFCTICYIFIVMKIFGI